MTSTQWKNVAASTILVSLIGGCGGIDICDVERISCMAKGGTWTSGTGECGGYCVYPTPEPTPTPTPEPTPTPTPEPTPTPTPIPTPECDLEGSPQARVYWRDPNRTADATPAVCNPKRCDRIGYAGRYCCPVWPEDHPNRWKCEVELMGGDVPVWYVTSSSGALYLAPTDWFGQVRGQGEGEVWWCFPNGKACSKKLPVSRP